MLFKHLSSLQEASAIVQISLIPSPCMLTCNWFIYCTYIKTCYFYRLFTWNSSMLIIIPEFCWKQQTFNSVYVAIRYFYWIIPNRHSNHGKLGTKIIDPKLLFYSRFCIFLGDFSCLKNMKIT